MFVALLAQFLVDALVTLFLLWVCLPSIARLFLRRRSDGAILAHLHGTCERMDVLLDVLGTDVSASGLREWRRVQGTADALWREADRRGLVYVPGRRGSVLG